ncbi:MAG: oligosaccharide flippase family protein, partial [Bradyrhizobium sp.]
MSLHKQAASLAIMHAADILQPLLVLPYAGLVLGPEQFGQFAYAMSLGQIAATLVEYGFHWTAQRTAAAARARPAALSVLLAEVTATKALLCVLVVAFGLFTAGALYLSKTMVLCAMLTAMGNVLFPAWLFIGTEQAWQATIGVVSARAFALAGFLALVTSPARVELAVAIQSSVPLISGIVVIPFVLRIGLTGFREVRFN